MIASRYLREGKPRPDDLKSPILSRCAVLRPVRTIESGDIRHRCAHAKIRARKPSQQQQETQAVKRERLESIVQWCRSYGIDEQCLANLSMWILTEADPKDVVVSIHQVEQGWTKIMAHHGVTPARQAFTEIMLNDNPSTKKPEK